MSCVLEVRNQHHSIWLTGDIEVAAEQAIVDRLILAPSVLKTIQQRNIILMAPHHGSKTSSNAYFLNLLRPHAAFSQSGYKNRYHHPHPSVVERYRTHGIHLLDTNATGAQIWQSNKAAMAQIFLRE